MRRAPSQQCQRKVPAIHRCGAAPGTNSRYCCPPRMRKNPPALETCHDLLQGKHNGQCVFILDKMSAPGLGRILLLKKNKINDQSVKESKRISDI